MDDAEYKVIDAMQKYGGSFVQALATLALQADRVNLDKIKATWPEYWQRYTDMAKEN